MIVRQAQWEAPHWWYAMQCYLPKLEMGHRCERLTLANPTALVKEKYGARANSNCGLGFVLHPRNLDNKLPVVTLEHAWSTTGPL